MRVLKSLSRFKVRAHIKNRVLFESVALYTHVSKNFISVSEISAVNFIVGWKLFASFVKLCIASLFVFHREKMPSMYFFQMSGLLGLWLMISVSTSAIKMLAKDTAIFGPIAVP